MKSLIWPTLEVDRADLQDLGLRSIYIYFHTSARRIVGSLYAVADS